MVTVHLAGGLGNQMFQYSFGKVLAKKNNCELKLDLSMFESYEWHDYSLKPFNIKAQICSKEESDFLTGQNLSFFERLKRKFLNRPTVIQEENLLYNPNYLDVQSPVYAKGYWQSEKYFSSFENDIRDDLFITVPPSPVNLEMFDRIKGKNAVSLHIRRGNYVQIDSVNKVHGTCSMDYYERAVELISSKVANPVFFVFSDDIVWAKDNLHLNFETVFIDINDSKSDYEDLRLMYSCKHHILANSTFSWWGAWLNPCPQKIVVAPEQWFADEELNMKTKDLIPPKWIRL